MHLLIYNRRPEVNSVVHAHPPAATAHAAAALGCFATNAAEPVTSRPMTTVTAKTFPSIVPSVSAPTVLALAAGL